MKKQATIPISLDADDKEDLSRITKEMALSTPNLIRLLAKAFCELYDSNKGKVEFPLELNQ